MSEQEDVASLLGALEFHPACSLHDNAKDEPCGNRAFFSCRLPHAEVHGGDPQAHHLLCYRCRAQHIRITFPFNCPFCGGRVEKREDWIADIKEL